MKLMRPTNPTEIARHATLLSALATMLAAGMTVTAAEPIKRLPVYREQIDIMRSDAQPAEHRYLAFPVVLTISPDEIWIAYKAGKSHALDTAAAIEVASHRFSTGATKLIQRLHPAAPNLYQMAEFVRLPGGMIALYIDVQVNREGKHFRVGTESYRWDAARNAFNGPAVLGPVGGVTYGYPFDFIVEGSASWQLIMTFEHLPGGRRSVDVLRSDDAGGSWQFVRDLTAEFGGIRANESAFMRHGDGFIVATRAYDNHARLHRTDGDFRVRQQIDLTERHPAVISGTVGRPRIFVRDGQGYLLGRNYAAPPTPGGPRRPMQLCLFRFDLETLAVTSYAVLDNAGEEKVTDGYYAVPVFSERDSRALLHVITYKGTAGKPPDIVRFDYLWDEVK